MSETPPKEVIMLEYRISILEGIVEWLLTNGVVVKSMDTTEMKTIHQQAVNLLRQRYPEIQIDIKFEGRWER
jgi:hypothetical protein